MKKTAVFAGSFDPFTLGHKDVVLRAAAIFDSVIVAVAVETGKKSMAIESRVKIAEASLSGIENVTVESFEGLLTDFLVKKNAGFLVRGARTGADFEYERSLMSVYKSQLPNLEFVILPAKPELAHISSTIVRSLVRLNGKIEGYVDTKVEKSVTQLYSE